VVFGDSGQLLANALSVTERWAGHPLPTGTFESTEHGDGGNDSITTLGGYDILVGGHADDTINAGDGDNLVFGDDGQIVYATDGRLSLITSTSTAAFGGVDNITSGAGQDIVLGGRLGDTIHAGAGNNMVFGDSGQLVADPSSVVYPWASHPLPIAMLETIEPGDGGVDTITTLGGMDLLMGGDGGDVIESGAGDDFVIADHATFNYANGVVVTITTTDTAIGGDDTIHAGADDDVVIGGTGADAIDGGTGRDLLLGDSATLNRASTLNDFRNPRFRALTGTEIYSTVPSSAGSLLIDTSTYYADPRGPAEWGDFQITLQHHAAGIAANLFGNDYIAGGADDDSIFGQLGDDVIQGDGSIDFVSGGGRVGAFRDAAGDLQVRASFEAAGDGHDYIEGGGGADVLFGNNGQDDIIGGSSDLFSSIAPALRPDGADLIFGSAGTDAGRNDAGDATLAGHANDADTIVGDNGNIYRLVGVNGAPAGGGGVATANGFLAFNYDNYTNGLPAVEQVHIVPRGVTLLDYTAGGPDFVGQAGPMVVGDIGAADEIHGESGDDTVYGGAGNDVLFGDAQDDDLIGGYGHDWISGGTGDDGILGDDGRIFTSRNGMAEPLSGVATASVQALLEGNGPGTINATVHVTGTLHKHVDLTPFELDPNKNMLFDPMFADDIIFGGLGRDFIHAGAGDDAVSGAEALGEAYLVNGGGLVRSDFNRPTNPGDALDYNETTTLFAQYDANNPMRRILLNPNGTLSTNNTGAEFFLNFDPTDGPLVAGSTTVRTDGDDLIFGDNGNDWLVGGTGRDHVFGGWGDDLINLDDDHRTGGGLNTTPDAEASYADFTYGGAGRDVLIANATGDNMVDTTGEFNSFLVPFSKFGPPTVNRAINPQMEQFLYSLGKADGADQTLSAPGVPTGGTAARNGEPFGELGVITPQDEAAGTNRGGPRDPQPGNNGGPTSGSTTTTSTTLAASSTTSPTATTSTPTSSTALTSATPTATTEPTTTSAPAPTGTTATPSIDWSGSSSSITTLPWAQGTQPKPVGLSVPTFDVDDDDDDLIDWAAAPTAAPVTGTSSTTPTLSAAPKNNGQAKK
jgi:Ca2+-binding RTX toxin-like protein